MSMNRKDLVAALATQSGLDSGQADAALRALTDVVTSAVARGEQVVIPGFLKIAKAERPARTGRHPQTGDPIEIAASTKVRVTPLKGLKDAVLAPAGAGS